MTIKYIHTFDKKVYNSQPRNDTYKINIFRAEDYVIYVGFYGNDTPKQKPNDTYKRSGALVNTVDGGLCIISRHVYLLFLYGDEINTLSTYWRDLKGSSTSERRWYRRPDKNDKSRLVTFGNFLDNH